MTRPGTAPDARIPITLLTGFLGSGKTTVLNRLLRHKDMADTAVIINELGAIGLDHDLVAEAGGDVVQLTNGCLCCAVRSDLVSTLFGLYAARVDGTLQPFRRVVIETTGLADPAPILLNLFTDEAVARRYRVDGVLTVVDAVNGTATLDAQPESVKQAAAADRLLLSKLDLAEPPAAEALTHRLTRLNPGCPMTSVANGEVDPRLLVDLGSDKSLGGEAALQRWMGLAESEGVPGAHDHPGADDYHGHDHAPGDAHVHPPGESPHRADVVTRSLVIDAPIAWENLVRWINQLQRAKGPALLRIKGIAHIEGKPDRPLVVHAVQEVFHPPQFLDRWPSADRRTRLVFILDESAAFLIDESLRLLQGEAPILSESPPESPR
jgi:G3E family GTPase